MDKKVYTKAEIEIRKFATDEVVVASSTEEIEPPSQGNDDLPIL